MQANSKYSMIQLAQLAKLLELSGGAISKEKLSILFLLFQRELLCRYGIISAASDRIMTGDKIAIEVLDEASVNGELPSIVFDLKNNSVSFTEKGLEMLAKTDYEDEMALNGWLCEADIKLIGKIVASQSKEEDQKEDLVGFFGHSNEFLSWPEIVKKNDHWDEINPGLRAYLKENEISGMLI